MTELDYPTRRDRTRQWTRLAEQQLRDSTWRPSGVEAEIAWHVSRAGRSPVMGLPPYIEEPVSVRVSRLTSWAPAIRLGMRAGGWDLPKGGIGAPSSTEYTLMDLPQLLSAVHLVAETIEPWHAIINGLPLSSYFDESEIAQKLAEVVPGFADHLADAERFFCGFGCIGETFMAIATGNVD